MNVNEKVIIKIDVQVLLKQIMGALAFIAVYDEDEIMDTDHVEFSLRAKIKNMKTIASSTLKLLQNSIDMEELSRHNSNMPSLLYQCSIAAAQENINKINKQKGKQ